MGEDCMYCGHNIDSHDGGSGRCRVDGCDCIMFDDGLPDDFEELELGEDPKGFVEDATEEDVAEEETSPLDGDADAL